MASSNVAAGNSEHRDPVWATEAFSYSDKATGFQRHLALRFQIIGLRWPCRIAKISMRPVTSRNEITEGREVGQPTL